MNAFTNEDLKRLKKCIPSSDVTGCLAISYQELNALLYRLECAEAFIKIELDPHDEDYLNQLLYAKLEWLRSKGDVSEPAKGRE